MSRIAEALSAETLPIAATTLAWRLKARIESVYTELVRLEALGLARPICGYVGSKRNRSPGWIST